MHISKPSLFTLSAIKLIRNNVFLIFFHGQKHKRYRFGCSFPFLVIGPLYPKLLIHLQFPGFKTK